jgi:hypothetical protein
VAMQMLRRFVLGVGELVAPSLRRKKVRSTFSADDPLPALAALSYLCSKLV